MLLHIVIIIILFIITSSRNMVNKQYNLFKFYNKNYFPLDEHLTKKELEYVKFIFHITPFEIWNRTMESKRLSFISYSHVINKDKLTSGRFAIGSILNPIDTFTLALDILKERKITIDRYLLKKDYRFGGLGWDFNKNLFKIYFRFLNKNCILNNKFLKEFKKKDINLLKNNKYWDEGIISFTYQNNCLIEKKLYFYEKYDKNNINQETLMISTKRGKIIQTDINKENFLDNKIINELNEKYKEINISLDTISQDNNNIIVYYPK